MIEWIYKMALYGSAEGWDGCGNKKKFLEEAETQMLRSQVGVS